MDYIEEALEKLKEWIDRVVDALLGPQVQPEHEPIPIPVDDRRRRGWCDFTYVKAALCKGMVIWSI